MSIRVVRLGSPRSADEGLRIGTVRRPPRGVPKSDFASRDFYDVWLPILSPSAELVAQAQTASTDAEWKRFCRSYVREMGRPDAAHALDLLVAFSHRTALAVGCYCEDEQRCHRSVLRTLLADRGAAIV